MLLQVLRSKPKLQKKMGELVYKGHRSFDLMINLQLGIRWSVAGGRLGRLPGGEGAAAAASGGGLETPDDLPGPLGHFSPTGGMPGMGAALGPAGPHPQQQHHAMPAVPGGTIELLPKLAPADFSAKTKALFPSNGSAATPAHASHDFVWKDYAPRVFRQLRALFGIDETEYTLSLAGSQALRQLNSPGKSGCMFFLSDDDAFLIKTMRKAEAKLLQDRLPAYHRHCAANPNTLITKFLGMHSVTPVDGAKVRFLVMSNIFATDLLIHKKFDLKGSTEGRTALKPGTVRTDPNVIWKDLDVDIRLRLEKHWYAHMCRWGVPPAAYLPHSLAIVSASAQPTATQLALS